MISESTTRLSEVNSLSSSKLTNSSENKSVERLILDNFTILNDPKSFHHYFSSYDFHDTEKDMVVFWRDVLIFLFEHKEQIGMKIGQILDYTRINNRRPIGLENVIVFLN